MNVMTATDSFPTRGHAAKRLSILEAGARVFCREGYAGANIDMISAEAGVSRQTVYNHYGDKDKLFAAVVTEVTRRCNARSFEVLATFPDQPDNLEKDLVAFAIRLTQNCLCDEDGKYLRKLIQGEGERHPQLFASWRIDGPGKVWSALAARFARLAYAGHLDLDDPDIAARQFLALVNTELQIPMLFGEKLENKRLQKTAACAVRTFLRAYGSKRSDDQEIPPGGNALRA
ncbi:TetR/AcrR family transcriptional regulator [Nitratireductor kimnyeongensis]|uniref:TetR/AcrR family transcriptional regulator n=1 Tax=Nitratireductor kimnyeongensis TaxID=430679 RepID=A0ABW0T8L4_9HYPH|nr:TetR/AcrR family transcriptional regulator [Nitratireductor kimnyeongensis]QZZ35900.1 TetR/AcrR family transcriptional regulator [Nitratireductor kimnyeongensis]